MLWTAADTISNPDIAEPWTIIRNPGQFAAGGWQVQQTLNISAYGTVSVASPRELEMIPEADRVHANRVFKTTQPMYVTDANQSLTSDVIYWKGIKYRVLRVFEYPQRGWWGAVAARMSGE
jgi:hypothetical protein